MCQIWRESVSLNVTVNVKEIINIIIDLAVSETGRCSSIVVVFFFCTI